jgi:Ca2+-binding EF-hand superfamily protein
MCCKAIYPRHFDTDEDGKVSVDELTRILLHMGDSAIPEEDLPLFLQATCLIPLTYYL